MTLRDDVRDYFEREARRLPAPSGLRDDVTSRAISKRPGASPAFRWAAVVAAMLALAIVVGLIATGAFKNSKGLVPVGPPIPVMPGTHGLVLDVSFANKSDGWVLLSKLVGNQHQFSVEATHDAGETWQSPVPVGGLVNIGTGPDSARHIHFVDRDNGFVWGSGVPLATHDGGRTWAVAGLPSDVVAITGQEGVVWAVQGSFMIESHNSVRVSADGGTSWLMTSRPPFAVFGAVSFGISGLLLEGFPGSNYLALTTDDGATWTTIHDPCPIESPISAAATADGSEIWDVCSSSPPAAPTSQVFVSEDSGRTWQQRLGTAAGVGVEEVLSPTPGTALVATDTSAGMAISHDSGDSWQRCVTDPRNAAVQSVSYSADGSVAVAVDNVYVVWISGDGGNTWNKTNSQP